MIGVQVTVCVSITLLVSAVTALYSSSDDVIELTPSNFNQKVINGDELWLVEFYAPWCGHCKSLAPEWKKAATALKGVVKIGAVDADQHNSLGGQYGVRGFPTIKIFGANKNSPQDYNGARNAQGIVDSAMSTLKSMVSGRLSGKSSGGGGGKKSGGGGGKPGDPADVITLTDANFEEKVMKSNDPWIVEFYAPWCGHCKNLEPHWASAATQLKGRVKFGALDATQHTVMSNRHNVRGFPTIKFFPAGTKGDPEEYDGGRTSSDIVSWLDDKVASNIPPPEVVQAIVENSLVDNCDEKQLCVISILPHILDCQSECRNKYIKILKTLGERFKKNKWGWVWAEAGAQPSLEDGLGIGGFGYPAMAALNIRKKKYSLLKGPYSETGIGEFLRDLSFGKGESAPLKNAALPNLVKTEKWDGKDGVLEVEEEIDLSDVELDDLDSTKEEL
ncbi:hypothetical protein SNE40_021841 [Patella caerulea]|uniref:protein disulfide-isomerase n=1 Tax=Patella caerulea TaxID=87958 RepID=A0AAN8G0W5_PATCE